MGVLFGSAFFVIPGIGPLVAAGPLVVAIVSALEGEVAVGAIGAFSNTRRKSRPVNFSSSHTGPVPKPNARETS